jgi:hypothetical protein
MATKSITIDAASLIANGGREGGEKKDLHIVFEKKKEENRVEDVESDEMDMERYCMMVCLDCLD